MGILIIPIIDREEEGGKKNKNRTENLERKGYYDQTKQQNLTERRTRTDPATIPASAEAAPAATSNRTGPDRTRNPRTDEDRNSNRTVPDPAHAPIHVPTKTAIARIPASDSTVPVVPVTISKRIVVVVVVVAAAVWQNEVVVVRSRA